MCENLKADRVRCGGCKTINLANTASHPKPNMEVYEKPCTPPVKMECKPPDLVVHPTCIKVCSKDELKLCQQGKSMPLPKRPVIAPHGKIAYLVKAGILVGTAFFTYNQGVWGEQAQAVECWSRWKEYMKSINSRQPPTFDACGNVVKTEIGGSLIAPLYDFYKDIITSCFSGVVKLPQILKCAYIDYLKAAEKRKDELARERKLKKL